MKSVILSLFLAATCSGQEVWIVPVKMESCGPCQRFNNEYRNPITGLRTWLKSRVVTARAVDVGPGKNPEFAQEWRIPKVPCFLLVDENEKELARIEGYNGPAWLKQQVTQKLREIQTRRKSVTRSVQKSEAQYSLPTCPPGALYCPQPQIDMSPVTNRLSQLESRLAALEGLEYVTVTEVQKSQDILLQHISSLQGEINDLKERGIANTQRIQALERQKRTVILKDGGVVVDQEEYLPAEPIVLDLKAITKK